MKQKYLICSFAFAVCSVFSGFANADLAEPKKAGSEVSTASTVARMRSLGEFAFSVGIADGRKERWFDIRKKMAGMKGELDSLYQVSHLYLDNGDMQPPIILTGENLYQNHQNGKATDHAQVRYEILAPARFVSSQLDWYTYIVSDEDLIGNRPADDPFFQPKNAEEEMVMKKFFQNGYSEGANQVD
ncbi:MAG TPA: type IV secretory system conjugative DNA transfer family protein, partial [Ignavibacteriaceae bacterium]